MVRQDRSTGIVEIAHTSNTKDSTDRWFVVRKVLDNAKQVCKLRQLILYLGCPLVIRRQNDPTNHSFHGA